MDIYRFMNSKDIASCLQEIDYEFNAMEAANLMRSLQFDEKARQLKGILDAWYPNEYYPDGVWKR